MARSATLTILGLAHPHPINRASSIVIPRGGTGGAGKGEEGTSSPILGGRGTGEEFFPCPCHHMADEGVWPVSSCSNYGLPQRMKMLSVLHTASPQFLAQHHCRLAANASLGGNTVLGRELHC